MQKRNSGTRTNNSALPKADAFLNLKVKGKVETLSFKSGIPLYKGRKLDDFILAHPEHLDAIFGNRVEASLHVVEDDTSSAPFEL